MEYPVIHLGQTVGKCEVTDQGLYWGIECQCRILSDRVERLYCGENRLGVLEQKGAVLTCSRRISKASVPSLSGTFSLSPQDNWKGYLLGRPFQCRMEGDRLLFPYKADEPCPCEPLICFFTVKDGFWCLPAKEQWLSSIGEDASCT